MPTTLLRTCCLRVCPDHIESVISILSHEEGLDIVLVASCLLYNDSRNSHCHCKTVILPSM